MSLISPSPCLSESKAGRNQTMEMMKLRKVSTGRKTKQIYLPEEIINQILVRLPTKSVLRFKLVSKLWLFLISQPTFKNIHLKHVLSNDNQQKIMIVSDGFRLPQFYLLDQDGKLVEQNYDFPFPAPEGIFVMGSCNGLLLVGIFDYDASYNHVILWNPLFNDYKIIPFKDPSFVKLYGFDYDMYSQDYKFIMINTFKQEVQVYNLKSGLLKTFSLYLDFGSICPHDYGRVFKGCIYWITLVNNNKEVALIEFNVRYEKFRHVNLPPEYKGVSYHVGVELNVVTKDCLGIFIHDYRRVYFNLVMMKKEDNGGGMSWNMVEFQNPPGKVGWPLCMVSNDEILMRFGNRFPEPERTPTNDLFIYNPREKTITDTGIHEAGNCPGHISYMETLVLPSSAD